MVEGAVGYHKGSAADRQSFGYHDAIRVMIGLVVALIAVVVAAAVVDAAAEAAAAASVLAN